VEDDDEFDDIADTFETAYNFRFEDPNANEIVGYARNQSTLRRNEENSRKRARDKKKEAKRAEEEKRKAEITKLKKHKVQQVMSRLEKLKEAIGDPDAAEALSAMDLDGEFDDTEWDRKMRNVFNDEFYAKVDSTDKPEFSDVGDDLDGDQDHDTEDAQGVPAEQSRAKSKKVERLKKKKDRDELRAKAEEFVEENLDLALDEANMADPIKSTFKYREVEPESFGLTARDILLASDKDLNAYAGLKAYAPYRDSSKKEKDKKKFAKKRRLREWRKAVFNSEDAPDDEAVREYLKKAAEDGSRKHKKAKKQKH
jgi:protein KRI1